MGRKVGNSVGEIFVSDSVLVCVLVPVPGEVGEKVGSCVGSFSPESVGVKVGISVGGAAVVSDSVLVCVLVPVSGSVGENVGVSVTGGLIGGKVPGAVVTESGLIVAPG